MTIAVKDGNGALQTVKTIDDLLALIALASKQDTGNGALAAILAKITADPATATGQAAIIAAIAGNLKTLDAGSAFATVWGISGVPFTSADQSGSVASVTDAPDSGTRLVVDDLIVSVDADMTVTFKEETSGTVIFGPWYLSAKSGPVQVTLRGKRKLPTINKKLQVITSVAGNITVLIGSHSE